MDRIRTAALRQAIESHLCNHGARDWKLVRDRFGDVPHATFWRAVKAVRTSSNSPAPVGCAEPQDGSLVSYLPPAYEPIKKMREFQEQLEHANDLIRQSKGLNGAIKNWQMHAKGVSLRQAVLSRQVEVTETLLDLNSMALLQNLLLDTLEAIDPTFRAKMIAEVQALYACDREEIYRRIRKTRDGWDELGDVSPR